MDPLVQKAIEEADIICRRAIETTPPAYQSYMVLIKQNKRVGGTRQNPIYAPIQLPYMKVDGRIREAQDVHKEAGEKLSIRTDILNLENGRVICQATVTSTMLGETQGTAEVNFGGKGVDETSPLENAETSAWGRALGAMGFGLLGTGMASADEVLAAMEAPASEGDNTSTPTESKASSPGKPPEQGGTPALDSKGPATDKQTHFLISLLESSGVVFGDAKELLETAHPRGLTRGTASRLISDLREVELIPNTLFGSYVNILMKRVGLQREAVDLYLTTYLEVDGIYSLNSDQQKQLIGWLSMAHDEEVA